MGLLLFRFVSIIADFVVVLLPAGMWGSPGEPECKPRAVCRLWSQAERAQGANESFSSRQPPARVAGRCVTMIADSNGSSDGNAATGRSCRATSGGDAKSGPMTAQQGFWPRWPIWTTRGVGALGGGLAKVRGMGGGQRTRRGTNWTVDQKGFQDARTMFDLAAMGRTCKGV